MLKIFPSFTFFSYSFIEGKAWIARIVILALALALLFMFPSSIYILNGHINDSTIAILDSPINNNLDVEFSSLDKSTEYISYDIKNFFSYKSLIKSKMKNLGLDLPLGFFVSNFGFEINISIIHNDNSTPDQSTGLIWFFSHGYFANYSNYFVDFLTNESKIPQKPNECLVFTPSSSKDISINDILNINTVEFNISGLFCNKEEPSQWNRIDYQFLPIFNLMSSQTFVVLLDISSYPLFSDKLPSNRNYNLISNIYYRYYHNSLKSTNLNLISQKHRELLDIISSTLTSNGWWISDSFKSHFQVIIEEAVDKINGGIPLFILNEIPNLILAIICYTSASIVIKRRYLQNLTIAIEKGITFFQASKKFIFEESIAIICSMILGILFFMTIQTIVFPANPQILFSFEEWISGLKYYHTIFLLVISIHIILSFAFDVDRLISSFKLFYQRKNERYNLFLDQLDKSKIFILNWRFFVLGIIFLITFLIMVSIDFLRFEKDFEQVVFITFVAFFIVCLTFPLFMLKLYPQILSLSEKIINKLSFNFLTLNLFQLRTFAHDRAISYLLLLVTFSSLISGVFMISTVENTRQSTAMFSIGSQYTARTYNSSANVSAIISYLQMNLSEYSIDNYASSNILEISAQNKLLFRLFGIENLTSFLDVFYLPKYIDLSIPRNKLSLIMNSNNILVSIDDLDRMGLHTGDNISFSSIYPAERTHFNIIGSFRVWSDFLPNNHYDYQNSENINPIEIVCNASLIDKLLSALGSAPSININYIKNIYIKFKNPNQINESRVLSLGMNLFLRFRTTIESYSDYLDQFLPYDVILIWESMIIYLILLSILTIITSPLAILFFSSLREVSHEIGIYRSMGIDTKSLFKVLLSVAGTMTLLSIILGFISGIILPLVLSKILFWQDQTVPLQFTIPLFDTISLSGLLFTIGLISFSYPLLASHKRAIADLLIKKE